MKYIYKYIRYIIKSKHRGGFGIHSPFIFHLVTFIIEETLPYYKFSLIELLRSKLRQDKTKIAVQDYGTGRSEERTISEIVKKSSKNKYYAQILFRLINFYKSENILELGTSFGITTMYLAAPSSKARVVTMEGSDQIADIAEKNFKKGRFNNIEIVRGNINQTIGLALSKFDKLDFVFFDANHRREPLLNYFDQCLSKVHSKTVFIIDDIYWSDDMEEAWNEIKQNPRVRVTIDMFFYGIVLFDPDLQREEYMLRYYPNPRQIAKEWTEKCSDRIFKLLNTVKK